MDEQPIEVIIEIGSAYMKCGFVGEAMPRRVLRNSKALTLFLSGEKSCIVSCGSEERIKKLYELVRKEIKSLLCDIFFSVLLICPNQVSRLFILENIFALHQNILNEIIKEVILEMDFSHSFKSNLQTEDSLQFLTAQYCSIACTGNLCGLVVDIGYAETRIVPVCFGREILNSVRIIPLGSKHILRELKRFVIDYNPHLIAEKIDCASTSSNKDSSFLFETQVLEDILIRICYSCSLNQAQERLRANCIPEAWSKIQDIKAEKNRLKDHRARRLGGKPVQEKTNPPSKVIPGGKGSIVRPKHNYSYIKFYHRADSILKIEQNRARTEAIELLFANNDNDYSIIDGILESLMSCEVDVRARIIGNIVLCGGCTMLAGFLHRFCASILDRLNDKRYKAIQNLSKSMLIFQSKNFPRNCYSWIGASVLCSSLHPQYVFSGSNPNSPTASHRRTESTISISETR